MANYCAVARSNYFRVKDEASFVAWAQDRGLDVLRSGTYPAHFGLIPSDRDGWPSSIFDEDKLDHVEFDLVAELAEHLADESVAVLMESGAEASRYVAGYAQAFTNTGAAVTVSLDDIYEKAKSKFGIVPTAAAY